MSNDSDTGTPRRQKSTLLSPLRYPGGKRRLASYIAEALRLNNLRPKLFIEPFAGGASVSLQLLNDNLVECVVLGEKDPLVASFWKVVFDDHTWLIEQIQRIKPTLETWKYFRYSILETDRERALACFFLNRTSFSGILNNSAGPIGGWSQKSVYKIDCRFTVETTVKRIQQVAALADRIRFVRHGEWYETIEAVRALDYKFDELFYYLDPPFYHKADRLYRYSFQEADHKQLHDRLGDLNAPYILSYDIAEPILELYSNNGIGPKRVELLYSAPQSAKLTTAQELIISNLLILPQVTRLW